MPRTTPPSLSSLSDRGLIARLSQLRERERETTLAVLLHLNEVQRRKLHLSQGYASLFDYCVEHLKYSRSAAARRIRTARCIHTYPEVWGMLRRGEVNLSTISLVASALSETTKDDLLGRIRHKSQREVEAIVAAYKPPVGLRDRVRPVCVRLPQADARGQNWTSSSHRCRSGTDSATGGRTHTPPANGSETPGASEDRVDPGSGAGARAQAFPLTSTLAPSRLEQKLMIQFVASRVFMEKYQEVCALLSNRIGNVTFERVFEVMLDEFIDRHSPRRRAERRERRRERAKTQAANGGTTEGARQERSARIQTARPDRSRRAPAVATKRSQHIEKPRRDRSRHVLVGGQDRSRYIPAAVRDKVYVRDKARCTYVGTSGKRCRSTRSLHIDHIVPFARGGPSTVDNLRLLCAKHNRLEAVRTYGEAFMTRFDRRE